MALRIIRLSDDEILRKKCREVKKIDERVLTLLDDMKDTMKSVDGVGLAAPQVGVLKRIVIIDVDDTFIEMINPVIEAEEGEQVDYEGCLSIPGEKGRVRRPARVKASYYNRFNEPMKIWGEEMLAVAICHELDHLDGILYIDKMLETDEEEEDEEGAGAEEEMKEVD